MILFDVEFDTHQTLSIKKEECVALIFGHQVNIPSEQQNTKRKPKNPSSDLEIFPNTQLCTYTPPSMTPKFLSNLGKLMRKSINKIKEFTIKKQISSEMEPKSVQPNEQDPKVFVKLKRFNRRLQAKGRALKYQEDQFNLK